MVLSVKRFEIHDGDGIRTTVFLKGCPLRCRWCHNPESFSQKPQIGYIKRKCLNCGLCTGCCPAHKMERGEHLFLRESCTACGKCPSVCPGEALVLYGEEKSTEELLPLLLEDKGFFDESGGGVTVSGGESLMQAEFCSELLGALKENGIHTAVDSCAQGSAEAVNLLLPVTDLFLLDIKAIDDETHIRCTGVSNRQILQNIRRIDGYGTPIEIRVPLVPGWNDREVEAIGQFVKTLSCVRGVKLLPYHNLGADKYRALGLPYPLENVEPPADKDVLETGVRLREMGVNVIDAGTA